MNERTNGNQIEDKYRPGIPWWQIEARKAKNYTKDTVDMNRECLINGGQELHNRERPNNREIHHQKQICN
jgi:hypothetical protein